MIQWIKNHIKIFKNIFIMAVLLVVIIEVFSITKQVNVHQLKQILVDLPMWKIFVMLIVGIASILPMTGYDIVLNRLLGKKPDKKVLFESSWLINTINNLVGFGGVLSIAMRTQFFGKDCEPKKIARSVSKVFFFAMSGLSILSLFGLIASLTGVIGSYLSQYNIWLIGGALYFPLVLILTLRKKDGFLGGLKNTERAMLVFSSLLEWIGVVVTFEVVGILLGVKVPIISCGVLIIAAMVMGLVSMIPGALGSFDVIMILGLAHFGVEESVVIAWILLYRISYYFVPFIIGIILGASSFGTAVNEKYKGIPKEIAQEVLHKLVTFLLFFTGILTVLAGILPQAFDDVKLLQRIGFWGAHLLTEAPKLIFGFVFLVLARSMSKRIERVYFPTLIIEVLALVYQIMQGFSWGITIYLAFLILLTLFTKPELYRKQLVLSLETAAKDGVMYFLLVVFYVGIGIYNRPTVVHHNQRLYEFFLFPNEHLWVEGLIAILVVLAFGYMFVRYLEGSKHKIGEPVDEERVLNILRRYGGNVTSQLVFLHDKDVWYYKNKDGEETVFLQFSTYNDKIAVMGDPNGREEDFFDALKEFSTEADLWGYVPIFYEVSEKMTLYLHELGFSFIKMGEEAHVSLESFSLSGKKNKNNRAVTNKILREGYTFDVIRPPFSDELMKQMSDISEEWLAGRVEKGFSLGFFDENYIQKGPLAIVNNPDGELVAYATIMPSYTAYGISVDLMRYSSKAPTSVMDFLFLSIYQYYKEQGFIEFDLGMAPLANVGTNRNSFVNERLANLVYNFGNEIYSFQGLRNYKNKHATSWIPKYTMYPRGKNILFIMMALIKIDNRPMKK
jgi:phosphatidylglycerol lysyltransferase